MAGPGWRVLTTRPSRLEAQPLKANAPETTAKIATVEVFIVFEMDPGRCRTFHRDATADG
jgi:hypothetical protein